MECIQDIDHDGDNARLTTQIEYEGIECDRCWDELFARPESQALLDRMANEAMTEIKAGRARRLSVGDL